MSLRLSSMCRHADEAEETDSRYQFRFTIIEFADSQAKAAPDNSAARFAAMAGHVQCEGWLEWKAGLCEGAERRS